MERSLIDQSPSMLSEVQRRSDMLVRTLPIALLPIFAGLISGLLIRFFLGTNQRQAAIASHRGAELLAGLVVAVVLCTALIILVRLGRPTISALLFISGWTLATTLAALQNGITTFWPALLIMPICAAGLLLDGVASITLAALDTLLVGVIAVFEREALGAMLLPSPFYSINFPIFAAGFWIAVFWSVAALTWLLAGSLQRALAQSRAHAAALGQLSAELEMRVGAQTAELARRAARAEVLYEVSRALTNTLDLPRVLELIAEHAARLLRFDSALVLLAQADGDGFTLMGAYRPPLALHETLAAAEPELRAIAEQRHAQVMLLAPHRSSGAVSPLATLVLPMHYGTVLRGVLVLIDSGNTVARRDDDDLALAEGLADQAAVAIANAQLVARLQESATFEERTRLARDIHDTLAQGLTGIVIQITAAEESLVDAPGEVPKHLDLARRMAREALAEARRSVWNLRAPALERGDLADALRGLAARPLHLGTPARFEQRGVPWALPPNVESALLRMCQEALANVSKHAHAAHVDVVLEYTPDAVALHIIDDGVGFDTTTELASPVAPGAWGGFGLVGMRERIAALGGILEITSRPGTHVRVVVPRADSGALRKQPERQISYETAASELGYAGRL